MGRKISLLLVFLLIMQTVTSAIGMNAQIDADSQGEFLFGEIVVTDKKGNVIDPGAERSEDVDVKVSVGYTVGNGAVEETKTLHLNDELKIESEQSGKLTNGQEEIGTFVVSTDGVLIVNINEKSPIDSEIHGNLVFEALIKGIEMKEKKEEEKNDASDKIGNVKEEINTEVVDKTAKAQDEVKGTTAKRTFELEENEGKSGFILELAEITDLDGNSFSEENLLNPRDEFQLKLNWKLENSHNYDAGDKITFALPKGIKIIDSIEIELKDASGGVVANAVITTDKKIELTFTDYVKEHSNVQGWLQIISKLDEEEVEVEDGEAILDPIGEEGELRIPINEGDKRKTIEKSGSTNKAYNADEINWKVIINKNKTSLENATVTDLLPEGTEYKEGSLVVTKLKVDLYGNVLGDAEEVDVTGETVVDGELTIPLGNIKDAYRVEYVTTVTDDEATQFKNNATLSDEELADVSIDATITINRGEAIKKKAAKGYDPKTGIIEWEIEFNYNEKSLEDVTLTDTWTPAGKLDLVENSLKFTEMKIDENGNAQETGNVGLPEGAELIPGENGFEVTGITTDKPYKVTYQTKVKDRVLDPFDVANAAGFGQESDGSGTHVGQYYGSKSAGTVDYKEKTIDWKIEINHDEYPMENISIVDTLSEGLTLLEDTIEITVDGKDYGNDYTVSGDNPFTIAFPDDFTTDKKIVITYQTKFDADHVPDQNPTNKANIIWTPEGENEQIEKEVEAGTELNENTKNNDWKNGSYDPATKEITWTIYTNYRENQIDELIVKDAPQGNQKIVADSVVVKELEIDKHGNISEGKALEDVTSIDEDANTLEVNIGNTDKAHKIEYRTSLEGLSDIQKEYMNKANIWNGSEKLNDVDATVSIVKSHTYGEKSGSQDGKQVHWSISVNVGQQKINNLKLEDTISNNQEYLVDSIKVYHATVDKNGNASKGEEVDEEKYQITHTPGDFTFTVEWKDTIERAFIVEYSTLFFEKHNGEVTNTYKVTGDSILGEDNSFEGGKKVTIQQFGSGGGSGEAGYLIIDKVDVTDGKDETKLAGAEFDLIDADTGKVLKSGVTDENGQIDFGRLLFGQYRLVETKVPEGYVTPNEKQEIEINKAYKPGDDKASFEYTVENYEPVFAIELFKTDDENNALAGAEFTLFDSEDKSVAIETTNEDGKILFEDLQVAGTYYVQETKAPTGFILDSTKHEVTIDEKEQKPVTISLDNTPRGAVQLTKIDADTKETLEGVEFELQKLNEDTGEYETVETDDPLITDENGNIETSNTLETGSYRFVEVKALEGYRTNSEPVHFEVNVTDPETQTFTMTNEKQKGSIKLIKKDAATEDLLEGAKFKLVDSEGEVVQENLETNNQGEIVVDDLLLGNYQLIETTAPEGYELDETPIDVTITEDGQVVEETIENHKITNISVEKQWNNNGGETIPVTVKLLPTEDTLELNDENDWKGIFKDLRVYDDFGEEIDYEVEELKVDGYASTVTGDKSSGFIVTNTELTTVSGEKIWLDNDSEDRPKTITVQLLVNDDVVGTKDVSAESNWTYEFTNLVKYDESGEEITYKVDEEVPEGYEKSIEGNDITNLRVGTTEIVGEKIWLDDDSEDRPDSITVQLLANGVVVDTTDVTAESNWTYEFTDLSKYDNEGVEIEYTVDEEDVPEGYIKSIEGNDITNLRVGTTEVDITKLWKDEDENDRPEKITINLLQNSDFYEEHEITAENGWELTITDLPQYDDKGKVYEYTVTEHDIAGYAAEIDGFEITNTRTDVKTIEITKTWLDDDSEDRPESIEVELFRSVTDGDLESVGIYTVTADNEWSLEIEDLPAFDNDGKAYTYEIDEITVEGYETFINGFDITNLRVGTTEVIGTKTWLDDDSEDRPNSITIYLLANDEIIDESKVTTESNWQYEFTNLDKYDEQGVEIEYTVDEEAIDGYEKSIDGYDIANLRIGTTEVKGTKYWKDDHPTERPEEIKVNLLQNRVVIDTVAVDETTDWKYEFTNLSKYDEKGVAYDYTVKEHGVPGYKSDVNGFDITNTRSEKTSVVVTKGWKDDHSENRPELITVNLLQNGEKFDTIKLGAEHNWKYEFRDLEAFDEDGIPYTYSIEEVAVSGYETIIDGYDITNLRVGTTAIEVQKRWENDSADVRPDQITVDLLQNGKVMETVNISAKSDWKYVFVELDKYDHNGKEYVYTIREHEVDHYEATVLTTERGFEITNTFVKESTEDSIVSPGKTDPKEKGGSIMPNTATPFYNLIFIGLIVIVVGLISLQVFRKRKDA